MARLVVRRFGPDVYNRCLTFMYGSREQIDKAMVRRHSGYENCKRQALGRWLCWENDKTGYQSDYILLIREGLLHSQFACLAHEAFHFVSHTLRQAGMPLANDSEEAYSYYLGDIIERCLRNMR